MKILGINQKKQEISLGIKQTMPPWSTVVEKYPAGTVVEGVVQNLTEYGAFIEIEEGIDGLLHVNDMSWVRKVAHPKEMLTKGEKGALRGSRRRPGEASHRPRAETIGQRPLANRYPGCFHIGDLKTGVVTKVANFGIFVELEAGLEGLLHISEVDADASQEPIKAGDSIEVCVFARRYRGTQNCVERQKGRKCVQR